METDLHILRQTHLSGLCRGARGQNFTKGVKLVQFSIMDCPGFGGFVYDAYTGWNSVSRVILEEVIPREWVHDVCVYCVHVVTACGDVLQQGRVHANQSPSDLI